MKNLIAMAGIAAMALVATPAAAVVMVSTPGSATSFAMPEGDVKIDFNDGVLPSNFTYTANNSYIKTGTDDNGAAPGFGDGSAYYTVLAGGSASMLTTGQGYDMISFFMGSLDTYNTVELLSVTGSVISSWTGSSFSPPAPANGDRTYEMTNRRVTFTREAGDASFGGLRISSAGNSAEIDNVVFAVPEPSTWAMMFLGFGMIGAATRARSRKAVGKAVTA